MQPAGSNAYHGVLDVLQTSDDSGSELNFVVGVLQVEDWDVLLVSVGDVSLHRLVDDGGSNVGIGLNESQVVLVLVGELTSHDL